MKKSPKKIQFQRQPTDSSCGQACMAMLLSKPVEKIGKEVGHLETTTTIECARLLRKHGIKASFKLMGGMMTRKGLPRTVFAVIQNRWFPTFYTKHAVVIKDGVVYDPAEGVYPLEALGAKGHSLYGYFRIGG